MNQMNYIKNSRDRILDLVLINADAISKCLVFPADDPLINIDPSHPALSLSLTCNKPVLYEEANFVNEFDFYKADFEALNYAFTNADWSSLRNAQNVDSAVELFVNTLNQVFHHYVPAPLPRRKPPWSNNFLRTLKRRRSNALKHYANMRTPNTNNI